MRKSILAALLLTFAGLQTANAQTVVLHKTNGEKVECLTSELDSITFVTPEEHEWVDLGLPSGTLWATCNVGASSPEEYGDYFSWGETKPKNTYSWSTYMWCNGSREDITKYCTGNGYGYNGFADNKTELDAEDDAATANWGSGWQMPSDEQIRELLDNCTRVCTEQGGVNGSLVTGPNGNKLFLPDAGYHGVTSYGLAGRYGSYWSRSLSEDRSDQACSLYSYGDWYWCHASNYRGDGLSVRPVRKQ